MNRAVSLVAFATVAYLVVASMYSVAFYYFPTPQLMDVRWKAGFALVGILLFVTNCGATCLTHFSNSFTIRHTTLHAGFAIYGAILAGWMIVQGPYSGISLSTVSIENKSPTAFNRVSVACRGDLKEITDLKPSVQIIVALVPKSEGPLTIHFYASNQLVSKAETVVFEAWGDRFLCTIDPNHQTIVTKE